MDWHGTIVCDADVLFGKPRVVGTRVSVERILHSLAAGDSIESILTNFPRLKESDIRAALAFAADALEREDDPALAEAGA
jgi:uncharacterized protein (DUF433 family)